MIHLRKNGCIFKIVLRFSIGVNIRTTWTAFLRSDCRVNPWTIWPAFKLVWNSHSFYSIFQTIQYEETRSAYRHLFGFDQHGECITSCSPGTPINDGSMRRFCESTIFEKYRIRPKKSSFRYSAYGFLSLAIPSSKCLRYIASPTFFAVLWSNPHEKKNAPVSTVWNRYRQLQPPRFIVLIYSSPSASEIKWFSERNEFFSLLLLDTFVKYVRMISVSQHDAICR